MNFPENYRAKILASRNVIIDLKSANALLTETNRKLERKVKRLNKKLNLAKNFTIKWK